MSVLKSQKYTFADLCSYNQVFNIHSKFFFVKFLIGSNPTTDSSQTALWMALNNFERFFADIKETDVNCTDMNRNEDCEGGGSLVVLIVLEKIVELT